MSLVAPLTSTPCAPDGSTVLSSSGMRRRNGSPFGPSAVESALAIFSAAIRIRVVCARKPDAAAEMASLMSVIYLSPRRPRRHFQKVQALLIEREPRLEL